MRIEIKPGTSIQRACAMAAEASTQHNERCEFTFNDREVYADPREMGPAIYERWCDVAGDPTADLQADPNRTIPLDNPHAFACASNNGHQPGMTLRDYFAAKALLGLLSYSDDRSEPPNTHHAEMIARDAYAFADAMLAARS